MCSTSGTLSAMKILRRDKKETRVSECGAGVPPPLGRGCGTPLLAGCERASVVGRVSGRIMAGTGRLAGVLRALAPSGQHESMRRPIPLLHCATPVVIRAFLFLAERALGQQ